MKIVNVDLNNNEINLQGIVIDLADNAELKALLTKLYTEANNEKAKAQK